MTTLETTTGPDRTSSESAATTASAPAPAGASAPTAGRVPDACTRRALLRRSAAAGAVGGGALVLAACGGDDASGGTATTATTATGEAGGDAAATSSVAAADVPVGEAVVLDVGGAEHVFAQPTAGEYVAFSAVCTHAGGIVAASGGTQVTCPLHNSVFDAADGGAVLSGPASSPLESETVTLDGDQLVLG